MDLQLKYDREFHSESHEYSIKVDMTNSLVTLVLPNETLSSTDFKYFIEKKDTIKQYEEGLVYQWVKRVLASAELDMGKPVDSWTIFPD